MPEVHGIISPHAGYEYSGKTCGSAMALLKGKQFKQVVILAANHTTPIFNADVDTCDAWKTPLGDVPVDHIVHELAKEEIFSTKTGAQDRGTCHRGGSRADHWPHISGD